MLTYKILRDGPISIDGATAKGEVIAPPMQTTFNLSSKRAQALKADGQVICGIIADGQIEDIARVAHSIYEVCSSKMVFPVLLCSSDLMMWKRTGFAMEWYSPTATNADAWLEDIRGVWGLDMIVTVDEFLQVYY